MTNRYMTTQLGPERGHTYRRWPERAPPPWLTTDHH
jgi:hypothetical protein